jgi:hypothetical protein
MIVSGKPLRLRPASGRTFCAPFSRRMAAIEPIAPTIARPVARAYRLSPFFRTRVAWTGRQAAPGARFVSPWFAARS